MYRSLRTIPLAFLTVFSAYLACAESTLSQRDAVPALAFDYEYIFTAHLNLGKAEKPIPIPGGVRVVEPILNGTVTGPAINATLGYSLATPTVVNNGTTQLPVINAVGVTDDGQPLYLYEQGAGSPSAQISRIVSDTLSGHAHNSSDKLMYHQQLEIAGSKYASLQDGFILASIQASADRKSVTVIGYLIKNAALK